ncbi:heterokaryon incompatibility protein-domain-containing protein [Lophiotrema nucula]|uniref:Heterokaryon incompatibility protein-domain-containing protein n=1 Tax=Lophiotrema nucula TaxID=690887 RepID=A0A6A5ZG73_9PLEO|nr:heterokaryon incompatibility protein-domain-containing protein [Lophiotrema nucula]
MRDSKSDRNFWADAICMDQDNKAEKSQQLPLMSRIYSEAKSVNVWLGEADLGDQGTSEAFTLMRKVREWRNYKTIVEKETTCDQWVAFTRLMDRAWFDRRWVVQEIVLAGHAELRCGSETIDWMHFAQAVAFFEYVKQPVEIKFRQDKQYDNHPDMFGEVRQYSASQLVRATVDVVTRGDDDRVIQRKESLESLISLLTPFETGKREDIIYAILSLARDVVATSADVSLKTNITLADVGDELLEGRNSEQQQQVVRALNQIVRNVKMDQFPVNYTKQFDEICEDLYRFTTVHSRSLDLICRPWCPPLSPEDQDKLQSYILPTWVRSLRERPYSKGRDGKMKRVNADTLVGLPGKSPYQASGTLREIGTSWSFERDHGILTLSSKGFQLDVIGRVEDTAHGGLIPDSWLEYTKRGHNTNSGKASGVSPQFWKTMVAGKGPNGDNTPVLYELLCNEIFDTSDAINLESLRKDSTNELLRDFIDRVSSVVWGRRLARTEKHRRLSLLPRAAEPGDVICILYGCSVPVVLRKTTRQTLNREMVWQLIGECFVYEMMSGEALVTRRQESDKEGRTHPGAQDSDSFYKNWRVFKIQ